MDAMNDVRRCLVCLAFQGGFVVLLRRLADLAVGPFKTQVRKAKGHCRRAKPSSDFRIGKSDEKPLSLSLALALLLNLLVDAGAFSRTRSTFLYQVLRSNPTNEPSLCRALQHEHATSDITPPSGSILGSWILRNDNGGQGDLVEPQSQTCRVAL